LFDVWPVLAVGVDGVGTPGAGIGRRPIQVQEDTHVNGDESGDPEQEPHECVHL
jgi:hypothetical protein